MSFSVKIQLDPDAGAAYTSTMEHRCKFDRPHGQILLQAYSFFMGGQNNCFSYFWLFKISHN